MTNSARDAIRFLSFFRTFGIPVNSIRRAEDCPPYLLHLPFVGRARHSVARRRASSFRPYDMRAKYIDGTREALQNSTFTVDFAAAACPATLGCPAALAVLIERAKDIGRSLPPLICPPG